MSRVRRDDAKPDALGNVIQYRDLLRAELAKIEGHLAVAEKLSAASWQRELTCWLASDVEVPDRLH